MMLARTLAGRLRVNGPARLPVSLVGFDRAVFEPRPGQPHDGGARGILLVCSNPKLAQHLRQCSTARLFDS